MSFPRERPYFPLPVRESGGRLSNPKGPIRRSSGASILRRLRYGDASMVLLRGCRFLLMNPWYNVFKIERSLYACKACVSVLWFKPFKIPFSASRSLYRNNERNKKTYLS